MLSAACAVGNCLMLSVIGLSSLIFALRHGSTTADEEAAIGHGSSAEAAGGKARASEAVGSTSTVTWMDAGAVTGTTVGGALPPPTCTALLPCLLDHEAAIIEETLAHLLALTEFEAIYLTYNTRSHVRPPAKLLARLEALCQSDRRLRMLHNPGSTSKATNLNAALPHVLSEYILIVDADHHIDEAFVSTLSESLAQADESVACMQASRSLALTACVPHSLAR